MSKPKRKRQKSKLKKAKVQEDAPALIAATSNGIKSTKKQKRKAEKADSSSAKPSKKQKHKAKKSKKMLNLRRKLSMASRKLIRRYFNILLT